MAEAAKYAVGRRTLVLAACKKGLVSIALQVNLDTPDGFALVGDRTVELRGQSCSRYREGNHVLDAQVLCEVVQPQ